MPFRCLLKEAVERKLVRPKLHQVLHRTTLTTLMLITFYGHGRCRRHFVGQLNRPK